MTKHEIIFEDFSIKYNEDVQSVTEAVEILNKVHFSKKDLQDPNTIKKKIEEPAEKFKSNGEFISALISILTLIVSIIGGVASGAIVLIPVGFGLGLFLCIKLLSAFENASAKYLENNKEKYNKQFAKLKSDCEKVIKENKNPKAVKEATDILNNLKKVEKYLSDQAKIAEKENYKNSYNSIKDDYLKAIDFLNGKYISNDFNHTEGNFKGGYILTILSTKNIGVTPEKYFDIVEKKYKNKLVKLGNTYRSEYFKASFNEIIRNGLEKLNVAEDTLIYDIYLNNDIDCFYLPSKKKIVVIDSGVYTYSPSNFVKEYIKDPMQDYMHKENVVILKDVDKDLGYYKFSECPKNVQQKPFPKF